MLPRSLPRWICVRFCRIQCQDRLRQVDLRFRPVWVDYSIATWQPAGAGLVSKSQSRDAQKLRRSRRPTRPSARTSGGPSRAGPWPMSNRSRSVRSPAGRNVRLADPFSRSTRPSRPTWRSRLGRRSGDVVHSSSAILVREHYDDAFSTCGRRPRSASRRPRIRGAPTRAPTRRSRAAVGDGHALRRRCSCCQRIFAWLGSVVRVVVVTVSRRDA